MDDKEQKEKYCHPIPAQPEILPSPMRIGKYEITPILLYLPDTEYYVARWKRAQEHFKERGLHGIIEIAGLHGRTVGIKGTHPYTIDDPSGNYIIGDGYLSEFLNMYTLYTLMSVLPSSHFMKLECDARLVPDYLHHLERELENVPEDFDFLFVGSCCVQDKLQKHVKGNVYQLDSTTKFCNCGHNYIVARKALPHVLSTQRDGYAPSDINLAIHTLPDLKVFVIYPRLSDQFDNNLPL